MTTPGSVVSRRLAAPLKGWALGVGLVEIVGERMIFGSVYEKEVVVAATGHCGWLPAYEVKEYEDEGKVLAFVPRPRTPEQTALPV